MLELRALEPAGLWCASQDHPGIWRKIKSYNHIKLAVCHEKIKRSGRWSWYSTSWIFMSSLHWPFDPNHPRHLFQLHIDSWGWQSAPHCRLCTWCCSAFVQSKWREKLYGCHKPLAGTEHTVYISGPASGEHLDLGRVAINDSAGYCCWPAGCCQCHFFTTSQ